MGRVKVKGMGDWQLQLEALASPATARRIAKKAVWSGANVMRDAIIGAVESIPARGPGYRATAPGSAIPWWGTDGWDGQIKNLTTEQKEGLIQGFGIAPIKESGGKWSTKTSFSGSNNVHTDEWPEGQPNSMIAAQLENGASFRARQPVISEAIKRNKAKAQAAMTATGEAEILKTTGGK